MLHNALKRPLNINAGHQAFLESLSEADRNLLESKLENGHSYNRVSLSSEQWKRIEELSKMKGSTLNVINKGIYSIEYPAKQPIRISEFKPTEAASIRPEHIY